MFDVKKLIRFGGLFIAVLIAPFAHSQDPHTMNPDAQHVAAAQRLIDQHFAIWNERDDQVRLQQFATTYTDDFTVADYAAIARGFDEVNQLIERVQSQHEGFRFSPEPIAWNHDIGRVRWGFGPAGEPDKVRGEDIFTVRDGKLLSMHVFLDHN
jgi:hypothetical protein